MLCWERRQRRRSRRRVASAARQLVVPFENASGEHRVYWLSEGSAVLVADDLVALGVPAIRREDRVRAFERLP